MKKTEWIEIETEEEYNQALERYEKVKRSKKGSEEHKEKQLLVLLISAYEKANSDLPEVDPIELKKSAWRILVINLQTWQRNMVIRAPLVKF